MNPTNRWFRRIGLFALLCVGVAFSPFQSTFAQQAPGKLGQQMVGSWTIASVVLEQGGVRRDVYGPDPRGFATFDANGHFALMLMRPDLPRIASNNREKPSDEEARAVAQGILAYYGTYTVSDADGTATFLITSSSFANWNGTTQKRLVAFSGDELRFTNPTPPIGGGTAYIVWKRTK